MELSDEIKEKIIIDNKREQLINSEFKLMGASGKLSGNIKTILYSEERDKQLNAIEKIRENLDEIYVNLIGISDALRIDFREIVDKNKAMDI